ncbi:MAG: Uncharacterised protein [Synechococcus sp. CC9902]|nr:MAG: Uncharacterised protein [Synechococcus sp. CC9902]
MKQLGFTGGAERASADLFRVQSLMLKLQNSGRAQIESIAIGLGVVLNSTGLHQRCSFIAS